MIKIVWIRQRYRSATNFTSQRQGLVIDGVVTATEQSGSAAAAAEQCPGRPALHWPRSAVHIRRRAQWSALAIDIVRNKRTLNTAQPHH